MAIFDVLTGGATGKAAKVSQQFTQQQMDYIRNLLQTGQSQGINALQSGATQAQDILSGALPQATGAVTSGVDAARAALTGGTTAATNAISGQGIPQSLAYLSSTLGPAIDRTTSGADMYADLMGLNGPEGTARATAAFKAGPAYNFDLSQGLEAINRRRAMAGELAGGNADREAQDYGAGLASNEFGNYRTALGVYNPLEANLRTTAGTTGSNIINQGYSKIADLLSQGGINLSNLESGSGSTLANLISKFAGAQAGIPEDTATRIANLISATSGQQVSSTDALTKNLTDALITGGKASDQGSKNLLDLIGSGISGLAGAEPGTFLGNILGLKAAT